MNLSLMTEVAERKKVEEELQSARDELSPSAAADP